MLSWLLRAAAVSACVLFLASSPASAQTAVTVAAASDLKFALDEISASFEARTGTTVRIAYGSSGAFRRQIAEGAPFDLFFSADEELVDALFREGRTLDEGALYAIGRIALLVPDHGTLRPDPTLGDLAAALDDGRLKKFAIANPDHAPYGRAARETLRRAGLWEKIRGRLVLGENVSQAAQFATSGSAQGGIVAYSLVLAPAISRLGRHALIPAEWHQPLRQRMVLLKRAGVEASAFYAYIQTPAARAVFDKYGFTLP
jgi:molybdate transport system substrate-binding protein